MFTSDPDCIHSPNVIFLPQRLDVYKFIQDCDALVQLSDTEACSYSINEALMYGKKIVVTPLPYLQELPRINEKGIILDFNLKNIKDVVQKIKSLKSQNNSSATNYVSPLEDNYRKYLAEGESHYKEEMGRMKKIRARVKFKDMLHNNCLRHIGEEFIESDARADDLISRGFATLVEEIKEKKVEIETAVAKEEKKEKAVKEKAIKPLKKEAKKNAKK